MSFFLQTLGIARPRMAADLNGMSLYAWSLSIPSLAAAFITLLFSKFSDMYGRRFMLLICMILSLAGTVWSALAPTYVILIAGETLSRLGTGALMPLLYSVLGDMFEPVARSKWVGLLRIPQGFLALLGPTLGGWFVDNLSWRHIYWLGVPFLVLCLFMVPMGVPSTAKKSKPQNRRAGCHTGCGRVVGDNSRSFFRRNHLSLGIAPDNRPAGRCTDVLGAFLQGRRACG